MIKGSLFFVFVTLSGSCKKCELIQRCPPGCPGFWRDMINVSRKGAVDDPVTPLHTSHAPLLMTPCELVTKQKQQWTREDEEECTWRGLVKRIDCVIMIIKEGDDYNDYINIVITASIWFTQAFYYGDNCPCHHTVQFNQFRHNGKCKTTPYKQTTPTMIVIKNTISRT